MPKNLQNKITAGKAPANDLELEVFNEVKEKTDTCFYEIQKNIQALPLHGKEQILNTTNNFFRQLIVSFEKENEVTSCMAEVENKKKINLIFEKLYEIWQQNTAFCSQNIASYNTYLAEITKEQIRLIHSLLHNIQLYTASISSLYATVDITIVDTLKKQQVEFANDLFTTIKQTDHFFAPPPFQEDRTKREETTSAFIHTLLTKIKKHDAWLVNYYNTLDKESDYPCLKTENIKLIRNLISSIQKYNNVVLYIEQTMKNKKEEAIQKKSNLATDEPLTLEKSTSDISQPSNVETSSTTDLFLAPLPEGEAVDIHILLEILAKLIQQGRLENLENYKQYCLDYLTEHQAQSTKIHLFDRLMQDILAIIDRIKTLFSSASSVPKTHPPRNGFFFNDIRKGITCVLDNAHTLGNTSLYR